MAQMPIRTALTQLDVFMLAGSAVTNVTLVQGQWVKLGENICPAGLYRSIGYGSNGSQADATGRIYVKLNSSTPTEQTGRFRISIFSPQDRSMMVLGEWHSSALDQNATDRTKQLPLPQIQAQIGKDYKFVFEFKADAAGLTVTAANSVIVIDCTEQLLA